MEQWHALQPLSTKFFVKDRKYTRTIFGIESEIVVESGIAVLALDLCNTHLAILCVAHPRNLILLSTVPWESRPQPVTSVSSVDGEPDKRFAGASEFNLLLEILWIFNGNLIMHPVSVIDVELVITDSITFTDI